MLSENSEIIESNLQDDLGVMRKSINLDQGHKRG